MRRGRFQLRTLLGAFVLVGVGLVLWQHVIEPRFFSPGLDGCTVLADKNRTYNAWIAYSENRPRIGHLDLCLIEGTTQSQPGGADYRNSYGMYGINDHARATVDGTRVFARAGGMRLFIRWQDGSWEERFISDADMAKRTNAKGRLHSQAEFWGWVIDSQGGR